MLFYLSLALHEGRPSTLETFSTKKRTSSMYFKTRNFFIFSIFVGHCCPPGSGPRSRPNKCGSMRIWIRIRNTAFEIKLCLSADFWQTGIGHKTGGFAYELPQGRFTAYHQTTYSKVLAFHASEFVILYRLKKYKPKTL